MQTVTFDLLNLEKRLRLKQFSVPDIAAMSVPGRDLPDRLMCGIVKVTLLWRFATMPTQQLFMHIRDLLGDRGHLGG